MEKFYTPEIEDFHIGFEYEFNDIGTDGKNLYQEWHKAIIKDGTQIDDITRKERGEKVYNLRVKFLDRQDIEECGWLHNSKINIDEERQKYVDCWIIKTDNTEDKEKYYQMYLDEGKAYISFIQYQNSVGSTESCLFQGTIRNKSEFKKLTAQLGINQ